jgi:hypothetical protein
MAFAIFGPGSLYLTRTDVANSTPVNIGYVQEFSLDEAAETKDLFGQNQYPLVSARGTIKITGKAKAAELSGIAVNNCYHGQSNFSSGQLQMASSPSTAIPTTPFQITPTVPGSGTWTTDLGVINAATGLPFQKVASGPTTGQYSVAAGVYTFAAADDSGGNAYSVIITFAYTTTGSGQTMIVTNQLIGTTPLFQLDYATTLNGNPYYLRLFQCIASKLGQSFKLTDFMMPEIDFSVFANAAGQVYEASYPQIG